eukprot:scaffold140456_cov21-Tisochrysis_lutea.AAC.1
MLRFPPSLPSKPKAMPSEPTPRSVVCSAIFSKPHKRWACLSHPNFLVNSEQGARSKEQAAQQAAAPFERGKTLDAGGMSQHEEDSFQHLVFAYSSPAFHKHVSAAFDHLLAYIKLGVAAALQAILHSLGVLQMLLSSAAQRVGLEPTQQAVDAAALSTASQLWTQRIPQFVEGQTGLQAQQSPRGFQHQHFKPHSSAPLAYMHGTTPSLAPLANMHSTTPSGNGAASTANMYTTAAQQRIATAVQGVQQSPAFAMVCSLNPLQRLAGAVLVLLVVLGPQLMLLKARRRAAEAEAEKQRQASALSLKLQKQDIRMPPPASITDGMPRGPWSKIGMDKDRHGQVLPAWTSPPSPLPPPHECLHVPFDSQDLYTKSLSLVLKNVHRMKVSRQGRFRAALAFDAVHLELPGIKESDVDPSDLVAR